jgi:hypothetical protein
VVRFSLFTVSSTASDVLEYITSDKSNRGLSNQGKAKAEGGDLASPIATKLRKLSVISTSRDLAGLHVPRVRELLHKIRAIHFGEL